MIGGWTQLMFCLHLVFYSSVEDGKQHTQGCTHYSKRQILFHLFSLAFRLGSYLWIPWCSPVSIRFHPVRAYIYWIKQDSLHNWGCTCVIKQPIHLIWISLSRPEAWPWGPRRGSWCSEPMAVPALLHEVGKHAEIKGSSSSGWWNSFERAPVALDFSAS